MLSRYRVLGKLGAGGMGVVYRAEDLTLKRPVALKVITGALHEDEHARARFLREARTAASLNHPNICAVYDFGEVQRGEETTLGGGERLEPGTPFIAMELVDGRTLAALLRDRGALRFSELIDIAIQVAGGLAAAHAHGVVHRDLKPGNVMLSSDGRARILDFGLAKPLAAPAPDGTGTTTTTTLSKAMTTEGKIVGTVEYMSPEQATGLPLDSRSDVFSFGTMLYEMATGKHPFAGGTPVTMLGKMLEAEPEPLEEVNLGLPAELGKIARRCLRKKPEERYNDTRDLVIALEELRESVASASRPGKPEAGAVTSAPVSVAPGHGGWRSWVLDSRSIAALVVAIAGMLWGGASLFAPHRRPAAGATVSMSITLPDSLRDVQPASRRKAALSFSLSPDDRWIAFSGLRGNGEQALFLRRLDQFDVVEVPGGGWAPFFSPDGETLGFLRGSDVWRTPVDRIAPLRIGRIANAYESFIGRLLWHPKGDIVVAMDTGIWTLPAKGGEPSLAISPDLTRQEAFRDVSLLPDGRLLVTVGDPQGSHLAAADLATGEIVPTRGEPGGLYARGWLLDWASGQLSASRFDVARMQRTGDRIPSAVGGWVSGAVPMVSAAGSVAWLAEEDQPREPVWVSRSGEETALPVRMPSEMIRWPRVSPDGKRLAVGCAFRDVERGGTYAVHIVDLRTGARTPLSSPNGGEPVWLPNGSGVVTSSVKANHGLDLQPADGRPAQPRLRVDHNCFPTSMHPDGNMILFYGADFARAEGQDLFVLDLRSGQALRIRMADRQKGGRFSPDGRWIAYQSNESGRDEVKVTPWPSLDSQYAVSADGGTEPIWSTDGREIFFRNGDKVMMAKVLPGPAFATLPPVKLFAGAYLHDPNDDQSWDLAPDGRFLMMKPTRLARLEVRVAKGFVASLEK